MFMTEVKEMDITRDLLIERVPLGRVTPDTVHHNGHRVTNPFAYVGSQCYTMLSHF